jgi:GNAT superfamily N-acetyltransferase
MPLMTTEEHAPLRAWLDRFLAADPVRGTVLGTIRASLGDGAWGATDGRDSLAARSSAAHQVVLAGDWAPPERRELRALLVELPGVRGLAGPPPIVTDLAGDFHGTRQRLDQALYRLDELREPPRVLGYAATADAADGTERALLRDWFAAFLADVEEQPRPGDTTLDVAIDGGNCWLWRGATGTPMSMACRRAVFDGSARIGPVYTPREHRGHGYGSAVTAAATRDILAEGAVPVLFTDLANPTSNKIYQDLGYYRIDERLVITFTGDA